MTVHAHCRLLKLAHESHDTHRTVGRSRWTSRTGSSGSYRAIFGRCNSSTGTGGRRGRAKGVFSSGRRSSSCARASLALPPTLHNTEVETGKRVREKAKAESQQTQNERTNERRGEKVERDRPNAANVSEEFDGKRASERGGGGVRGPRLLAPAFVARLLAEGEERNVGERSPLPLENVGAFAAYLPVGALLAHLGDDDEGSGRTHLWSCCLASPSNQQGDVVDGREREPSATKKLSSPSLGRVSEWEPLATVVGIGALLVSSATCCPTRPADTYSTTTLTLFLAEELRLAGFTQHERRHRLIPERSSIFVRVSLNFYDVDDPWMPFATLQELGK